MSILGYLKGLGRAFLGRPAERAYWNPENPLSDPAEWQLAGRETESGVGVNEFTALQHGPVWRAVNLISGDVARVPFLVYRREGENSKVRLSQDPAFRILAKRPNPYWSAFVFIKQQTADYLLWGNAYAYIVRDGNGRPAALIRLAPWTVEPKRDEAGVLYYEVWVDGYNPVQIDASEIVHIRGIGDNEKGVSVIQMARESLSLGIATRTHGQKFFKQGARATFVIEVPDSIGPDGVKLIQDQFPKKYGGLEKQHIPIVLDQGAKGNQFTTSNEDAQFLGSREFDLVEVSHWFNVPPGKLGHTARTGYASVEQENLSYLDSLDPHFVCWEQESDEKLLSLEQKRSQDVFTEFLREALVRVDVKTQWAVYKEQVFTGAINLNELRARISMPKLSGKVGEVHMVPANMMNAEELLEPDPPPVKNVPAENSPPPGQEAAAGEEEGSGEGETYSTEEDQERAAVLDLIKRSCRRVELQAIRKRATELKWRRFLQGELREKHRPSIHGMAVPILNLSEDLPTPEDFSSRLCERAVEELHGAQEAEDIIAAMGRVAEDLEAFTKKG